MGSRSTLLRPGLVLAWVTWTAPLFVHGTALAQRPGSDPTSPTPDFHEPPGNPPEPETPAHDSSGALGTSEPGDAARATEPGSEGQPAPGETTAPTSALDPAPSATADPAPTEPTDPRLTEASPAITPLPPGVEARPVPNYDGRPPPPTSVGQGLLWIPRVALFPLYVVSEYVIRKPLGALVTAAEKGKWLAVLGDFFTFDQAQKVGIVPTAYLEFGFEPSVGLYFFADDTFADRNDVRIQASMWPDDWWSLSALNRYTNASDGFSVELRGQYLTRPDYLYHGLGPLNRRSDRSRYSAQTIFGELGIEGRPWRASTVQSELGVRNWRFSANTDFRDDDDPSLAEALVDPDHTVSELPPGFADGYTAAYFGAAIALDTRRPFPAPRDGIRIEGSGEYVHSVRGRDAWVRTTAAAGGFLDVGSQRTLSLSVWTGFTEPIAGTLPFSELMEVGGFEPMGGFFQGRLRDRSRAGATFEYRWPVWIWVDMAIHYSLGNVFGPSLAGLEVDNLRSSFGLGLRSARASDPDHSLQFLLAFGTETIGQGSEISTVRLLFGGSRGF